MDVNQGVHEQEDDHDLTIFGNNEVKLLYSHHQLPSLS